MGQQVRQRRQGTINVSAFGAKYTQTLSRGYWLREIVLKWSGSLTAAAGANAAATLGKGDEWSLLSRIDLVANGTDVIRSFSGLGLRMLNRFLYGQLPRLSTAVGDGNANPTFLSYLIIPVWMPMSVKPMDTALDTRKLSDLRLEVTIAPASDYNSAASPTVIAASLDVNTIESFGVDGDVSDCKIYTLQSNLLAATGNNQQISLPVTCLYRGVLVNFATGGGVTYADQAADKITRVAFKSGTTVFRDYDWATVREWQNMRTNHWKQLIATGGAATITGGQTNTSKSTLHNEDAWAFLDFVQDGYLGEGIDALGLSEFYMEVDTSGATTPYATIIPIQIFPRRNAG